MSYKEALIKNMDSEFISGKNYNTSDSDDELSLYKFKTKKSLTEKVIKNKLKNDALLKAQDRLINSCIPNKKISEIIKKNLLNPNWKGFRFNIDMSKNLIRVYKNEKCFNFEKKRFFKKPNLNHFKYHLINKYVEIFGDKIWIQLKNNNDKFYLIISRKYTFSK